MICAFPHFLGPASTLKKAVDVDNITSSQQLEQSNNPMSQSATLYLQPVSPPNGQSVAPNEQVTPSLQSTNFSQQSYPAVYPMRDSTSLSVTISDGQTMDSSRPLELYAPFPPANSTSRLSVNSNGQSAFNPTQQSEPSLTRESQPPPMYPPPMSEPIDDSNRQSLNSRHSSIHLSNLPSTPTNSFPNKEINNRTSISIQSSSEREHPTPE